MISEYALDPELVAQWHDPKEWAFYREAFADGTGRVASAFPRKWRRLVMRAFRDQMPEVTNASPSWRRLEATLDRLSLRMIERESGEGNFATWLDRALAEHRQHPFDGILSTRMAADVAEVMTPRMLFEDLPPAAWKVPDCPAILRTASEFARVLSPLLTRSREVVFVDPWFNPDEARFADPLREMLSVLWGPKRCVEAPEAQLVTADGPKRPEVAHLLRRCQERLARIIPRNRSLVVTVLRQRPAGERIHNRYVLTNFAGVSIGGGLDVADEAGVQTDDLCRLSREQWLTRWAQYVSARESNFEVVARRVPISGAVQR